MGIQGMTNWKFSAFLTIALMLVAGLFSSTAMAAANDGQGTIAITTVSPGGAAGNASVILAAVARDLTSDPIVAGTPAIVSANGNGLGLTFTYSVTVPTGGSAINMKGGLVEITIPSGWTVPHASVTAEDEVALIPTDATGDDAAKRIVLTKSGDNATRVGVKLTTDEWNVAAGATASLTITFGAVTTATPSSLRSRPAGSHPYQEYTFRTKSMADKGSLRSLVIADNGLDPQPRLRVGVVTAGKGQLDVSPVVYESEKDRNISLVFTAQGPMYDYSGADITDVDSSIVITFPAGLTAPQTSSTSGDGFVTVTRQSGTVQFANPNEKITLDTSGTTPVATIDITRMENNSKIYISYRKVDVGTPDASAARFEATAASVSSTLVDVADKPDGAHVRTIAGSGEIKITDTSDDIVPVGSNPSLVFTYKAHTKLTDATLVIAQPTAAADGWQTLTLVMGSANVRARNYVTTSGGGNVAIDLTTTADAITLTGLDLAKNGSFTVRINRAMLEGDADADPVVPATPAGAYAWATTLNATGLDTDPTLYIVEVNTGVTFEIIPIPDPATNPAGRDAVSLPYYAAASKQNIQFRFTTETPIKNGYVRFTIPSGWAAPSLKDVKGKATVKLVDSAGALVDKIGDDVLTRAVNSNTITVNIKTFTPAADADAITVQYGTGTGDNMGMVQNKAQSEREIVGRFKSGGSSRDHPAAAPISVTIGNVAAGSGTAMITSPSSHTVKAGSKDNTIRLQFRAAGTMTEGRVRLHTPDEWGNLQETDSTKGNYIRVNASRSMVDQDEISYGPRYVLVRLMAVEANNTIEFVISNVKAQTTIGLAEFTIESAGNPSDSLVELLGVERPAKKDDKDKKEDDPYLLLGRVYQTHIADDPDTNDDETRDGLIRLGVVAGEGGTGEASLLEIVRTDSGLRDYLDDDGVVISERRVHAGDTEIYLVFKYTPVETIDDGALRFTVPNDWSPPQEESSNRAGYTTIEGSANLGAAEFENRVITIPIVNSDSGQNIEIHYGIGSLGAAAPKVKKTSEFNFAVKGTAGTFNSIGAVDVEVLSQASGRGSVSVATGMMAEDETPTVHAGDDMSSITITYDPIGQIANGRVKLTVPEALVGKDGVMRSHIAVSSGSAKYGGDVDLSLDANKDVTKNDVLVSGVNLRADAMFTFTYTATDTMRMPEATGDLSFTVAVDGGEGPGEVAEGMPAPMQVGNAVIVKVIDAKAGSGMVSITPMASVAASSTGNEVKVTYTAIGEIGEGKKITVTVPAGWSAPLTDAAAAEKMGTFTTKHYLKLADDDADGMPDAGDALAAAATMKATGAAADADPMIMVAEVASGKMVKAGDMVVFTYTNATATSMLGESRFTTTYDGAAVEGDDTILVVSASPATAISLSSDAMNGTFYIDDGLTVTVMLQDADGDEATRDTATTVTLSDNGAGGAFNPASISIASGDTEGESTYTPAGPADITITASADLGGATAATGEIMVTADTMTPMVTDGSVSVAPAIAKAGGMVTVSAMATPNRADGTVLFSIGSIINEGQMDEDEAGSYSGDTPALQADHHSDGTYDVTVSIMKGAETLDSETATGALIIDSTAPTVTVSTDAADMVGNGATITITAMVTEEGSGVAEGGVTADVSALDTTQTDKVALTMGDDGSYSAMITISEDNEAPNGTHAITVTAKDKADNESEMATAEVTLQNTMFYTSMLEGGTVTLIHVPLEVEGLDTVGKLRAKLGGETNVSLLAAMVNGSFDFADDNAEITADLGLLVNIREDTTVEFEGRPWGDGNSMINLNGGGPNLVGLPLDDDRITNISDILGLSDAITSIGVYSGGQLSIVVQEGDPADGAVAGDAAYVVNASGDIPISIPIMGRGWSNESTTAAPIAIAGYKVDNQTPAVAVYGSVVDEVTGLAKEGFRVKVKNLSTKAALSEITSAETADGYDMIFVDLTDAHAARVGDVLEISADSPDPLIGVKPVRHIVTIDDVKSSRIQLENLVAYEIPAETALLNNYPNPFNPETWIPYHLAEDADVKLTIYDANGALVRTIDIGHQTAAKYDTRAKAIYWDGRNRFGEQVASGIYFYSLSAGDFSATRKMVILK